MINKININVIEELEKFYDSFDEEISKKNYKYPIDFESKTVYLKSNDMEINPVMKTKKRKIIGKNIIVKNGLF